ncbi:hypothetical protein FOCC_FOCC002410 [Frankliniella occidentalis]|uniref:Leucine-rich repeat-containing protein 59 n=1 Tax=Frankliniella occidentalis TaxID=133901 RepID=A0A6J1RZW5_FRAOC|nr:leucine-rich repeat-containing protein 59 [Frankliniella occidentalis]XP_026273889.1 leucine-rich repeat-containing protein 59 [Frankliniella occidentalis]KAE8750982.1 hypothetical protein FOCC_FOCC002410 [Frankliniella occidentalis]
MAPQSRFRENVDGNKLDLSMSGITEVPVKDIASIKKATVLDLSDNQLTLLPPTFSSLTHLVELDLSKNMLQELPESFGNLINLKRLDLYGNKLTHLPLSFCHLKALRWLDLKNNPLVPMLAEIAGPCGDMQQCQQCARNVVATLTQTAIKVEEDRKRLLQEKLKEQEQIEQEYLLKKKELDSENQKKAKKRAKKNKAEKQIQDSNSKGNIATSTGAKVQAATEKESMREDNVPASSSKSFLRMILYFLIFCVGIVTTLLFCCILFAAYDRKLFLELIEDYNIASNDVTGPILYAAKYVENASKHPTFRELRSQLAVCFRSIIASILNIYKTICQEFPVYYDWLKSKFKV